MSESGSTSAQDKTTNPDTPNDNNSQELNSCIEEWSKQTFDLSQLSDLIKEVTSNDRLLQHHGAIGIKHLVSQEQGPIPIQEVIDAGIVPRFIEFMQNEKEVVLQMEAARIIANLLSGTNEQTKAIIDLGVLPALVKLLNSSSVEVLKDTVFALGNIAGDSTIFRDQILNQGGLGLLINIISIAQDPVLIKDTTFAISNLCRGKPKPNVQIVSQAIPVICAVIKKEIDSNTLADAVLALAEISGEITQIQAVIATGVVPSLIKHLESSDKLLLTQCLKILGNIITGDDQQTEFVISFPEFLPRLFELAQHQTKILRREACWIVSNITAGNPDQINIVMKNPEYVRILIHIATTDAPDIQREAVWALSNATIQGNAAQLPQATKMNVFDCLTGLLDHKDAKLLNVALEGIENILKSANIAAAEAGSEQNEFVLRLEENGGLTKIEELQAHANNEVYEKALKILENFFCLEEVA